jgi:TonB family protein
VLRVAAEAVREPILSLAAASLRLFDKRAVVPLAARAVPPSPFCPLFDFRWNRRRLVREVLSMTCALTLAGAVVALTPAIVDVTTPAGAATQAPQPPAVADASEIPAIEHDAIAPDVDIPGPRRTQYVAPVWPSPVTEAWRFRLHLVVDETGEVATVRVVQTLVGDPAARPVGPMGDLPTDLRSTPSARAGLAVLAAVRQWRFEPPTVSPLLIVTDVGVDQQDVTATGAERGVTREPLRAGGDVPPPRKVHDVRPVYPPDALRARISGVVTIEARIGPTGEVDEARVVSGVPMLDEPALAAVRQWRYEPTMVNGEPVPVIMTVDVTFSLSR